MVAAKMTESKLTPGSAVCYLTASSAVDTIVDEESKFANEDVTSEDIDDEEDIAVEDEDEDEVEYENTPMTVDELPFRGSTPLPAIPECNCVDETGNTFDCQCEPTCECVSKHRIAPDVCLCKDGSENLFDCACDADCECVTGHQIVPASDAPCRCSECANGIDACMPADEQCTKCTGDDSCSCEEGCSCFAEHTDIYSDMPSLMDYDDESFENNEVSPAPSTSRKRKNDDCECADDEVITCACVPAPHREFALSPAVKQSKQSPPTMPSWSSIVAAAAEPKRATMPQPIISKPIAAPTRAVQRTAGFPLTFGGSWPAAPASPSLKHPSWAAMVAASSPQQRQTVSNIATPRAAMSTSVERPGSSASMSSPPVYRANSPTLARKWSEVVGRDQMAAEDAEWTTVSARKNSPTRF